MNGQPQVLQLPQQQVVAPVQNAVLQQLQQQQLQTQVQETTAQVYQQVLTSSGNVETIPVRQKSSAFLFLPSFTCLSDSVDPRYNVAQYNYISLLINPLNFGLM